MLFIENYFKREARKLKVFFAFLLFGLFLLYGFKEFLKIPAIGYAVLRFLFIIIIILIMLYILGLIICIPFVVYKNSKEPVFACADKIKTENKLEDWQKVRIIQLYYDEVIRKKIRSKKYFSRLYYRQQLFFAREEVGRSAILTCLTSVIVSLFTSYITISTESFMLWVNIIISCLSAIGIISYIVLDILYPANKMVNDAEINSISYLLAPFIKPNVKCIDKIYFDDMERFQQIVIRGLLHKIYINNKINTEIICTIRLILELEASAFIESNKLKMISCIINDITIKYPCKVNVFEKGSVKIDPVKAKTISKNLKKILIVMHRYNVVHIN